MSSASKLSPSSDVDDVYASHMSGHHHHATPNVTTMYKCGDRHVSQTYKLNCETTQHGLTTTLHGDKDNLCVQNDAANYPLTCQIIHVVKSYQGFSKAETSTVTMHFTAAHSPRLCVVIRLLFKHIYTCLLYTSPSPRDRQKSRMPSSA